MTKIWENPANSAVMAALIVLMAFQVAAPPRLSDFASQETYEEFQEEDADPSESGEQSLPDFVGLPAGNSPRGQARFVQPFAAAVARRGARSRVQPYPHAELANRNGVGGPLRC